MDFTPESLSEVLGTKVLSVRAERIGEGLGVLSELSRLHLGYVDGHTGPASVVAKVPSSNEVVRELVTAFGLYDHEACFYRDVSEDVGIAVPRCYFSSTSADGGFVLVVEDMVGGRFADQLAGLDTADVAVALRTLARLHATWWDSPRLGELGWLTDMQDPGFRSLFESCAAFCEPFLERFGHLLGPDDHELARRAAQNLLVIIDRADTPPYTLNHGDFRADNLVYDTTAGARLAALDWQHVHRGHGGAYDVAYLLGGSVDPALRRASLTSLLRIYLDELESRGIEHYDLDSLVTDMRSAALLTIGVQLTGAVAVSNERGDRLMDRIVTGHFGLALDLDAGSGALRIPARLSSFVGREDELATVGRLLRPGGLVTLTGAGGCGKTRLAIEAAAAAASRFPDGAFWCDLAALGDPALVARSVGTAVGAQDPHVEAVVRVLSERTVLVVLDNCEHLVEACASLADSLLRGCPSIAVLATSREPLGVEGETTWRVPSLETDESARLFAERAAQARPGFRVDETNAAAVAQICERLDGIPLAIELAAARVRMLSPERIAAGLDDRFRLLGSGTRTALPRQRTLEASVAWSWELLSDDECVLFRRLAVFAGGFALDSAEEVCADERLDRWRVLEVLLQLVDRSLVQGEDGGRRYRLLETIRYYGRLKLAESGEAGAVQLRHLEHYTHVTEDAGPAVETGGRAVETLARLDADLDNVRAALDWAAGSGHAVEGLRLATACALYWPLRGHLAERNARIRALLDAAGEDAAPPLVARALVATAAVSGYAQSDRDSAAASLTRGLDLARELGDKRLEGRALLGLARLAFYADARSAVAPTEAALSVADSAGDVWAATQATTLLGQALGSTGDLAAARVLNEQAVDMARTSGDAVNLLRALSFVGESLVLEGRPRDAEVVLVEALSIAQALTDGWNAFGISTKLAGVAATSGDYATARELLEQSLREATAAGHGVAIMTSRIYLAQVARASGDEALAAASAGAAAELAELYGLPWHAGLARTLEAAIVAGTGEVERAEALLETVNPGPTSWLLSTRFVRAAIARMRGDLQGAQDHARSALAETGARSVGTADTLEVLAAVLAESGECEDAVRLFAAAYALRERTGCARWAMDETSYRSAVALAQDLLGHDGFSAAWDEGACLSAERAVAYATRGRGARGRPRAGWESLTPAELDVVGLVAQGLSNPQIGAKLFISRATVKTHLAHVFAKVGVSSRAELATEATRRAL